jgi:WD40 repeat protein
VSPAYQGWLCCLSAAGDGANSIKLFGQPSRLEAAAAATAAAGTTGSSDPLAADAAAPGTPERAREQERSDQQLNGVLQDAAAAAAAGDAAAAAGDAWECLCSVQQAHDADVNCVRWHPSRQGFLASAGDDGVVKLWQYKQLLQT